MSDVHHNEAEHRYELEADGGLAIADYQQRGDTLYFTHTEVPPQMQGKGIAAKLMEGAIADVRARGLKMKPVCSYVVAYVRRHPETQDLLAG